MAIERKDRVSDTTTTTGTGTVTLSGTAPDGYRAVTDAHTNGATVRYAISLGAEWEVGEGVFTTSGNTLTRAAVLASSNAGSLVNFSAGTKTVITTLTAAEVDGFSATKVQDFRLTLTTGLPVTVSDVSSAGTIYCTPYKGNQIALYSGSAWSIRSSAEFSLALSGLTSGKPYDVFCYDNSGTPTLEFLAWTNDTTRATALARQDGVLVKSGDATRRYLGTFYTTGTTTTEDSSAKRYLWNYYHRARRTMLRQETTASWTYTTATWRQANAAAANQIEFVCGVAEDAIVVDVSSFASNSSAGGTACGIGIDSTSANSAQRCGMNAGPTNNPVMATANYKGAQLGRHYAVWLEVSQAIGTSTWYGQITIAGVPTQSGIQGEIMG